MSRIGLRFRGVAVAILLLAATWAADSPPVRAAQILMKDGRVLRGSVVPVDSLVEEPKGTEAVNAIRRLVMLDDGLRRVFVSERQIQQMLVEEGQLEEKFTVRQRAARSGQMVRSVGSRLTGGRYDRFDEYGRRIFSFRVAERQIDIVQGITLITPQYAVVEGINYVWDMRIATSSIPPDILDQILRREINPDNVEHRKKLARFYLQIERYQSARQELEAILEAFPDVPDVEEQLAPSIRSIRQLEAQQAIRELRARREAGQHALVVRLLEEFPSEGVAGEILQEVREMLQDYAERDAQGRKVIEQLEAEVAKIDDRPLRLLIEPICKEIGEELSIDTLQRMAAFWQNVGDPDSSPQRKVSLAVSGWLLGADDAVENLPVALSLYRVRDQVREYLREPMKTIRDGIFSSMKSEEGALPGYVAAMLAHMKPPVEPPPPVSAEQPGFYSLEAPGAAGQPPVRYLVQLPPDYNPYRRYPAVVTLHGAGRTASLQVDWWAGGWAEGGWRAGQASRHGYIVIAPEWTVEHQEEYGYSAREHTAVLTSLRDACRQFAIDTDRVFLSGHSMGGDAAWDLGLAHPDLWAGVIPIVAQSDRYCIHYWPNAKQLPFYVVSGGLDGKKLIENARDLDRYLQRGYNCTVVEYQGRGHEHFYEEILRIFDWMGRFRRDFYPREFECSTMRAWDNCFWWVELKDLPSRSVVDPGDWPPPSGTRPMQVEAKITDSNGLIVTAGAQQATVWLAPEIIDFERRVTIRVNSRRLNPPDGFVEPDLRVLLEDARTRADRQHPFWAKL